MHDSSATGVSALLNAAAYYSAGFGSWPAIARALQQDSAREYLTADSVCCRFNGAPRDLAFTTQFRESTRRESENGQRQLPTCLCCTGHECWQQQLFNYSSTTGHLSPAR